MKIITISLVMCFMLMGCGNQKIKSVTNLNTIDTAKDTTITIPEDPNDFPLHSEIK